MGKGSGRRPAEVTDKELEKAWNSIFSGHPNEEQFDDDGYGNLLPKSMSDKEKPPITHKIIRRPRDPDRFIDETGDA